VVVHMCACNLHRGGVCVRVRVRGRVRVRACACACVCVCACTDLMRRMAVFSLYAYIFICVRVVWVGGWVDGCGWVGGCKDIYMWVYQHIPMSVWTYICGCINIYVLVYGHICGCINIYT